MANVRQYINNQDFGESREYRDLKISIDWKEKKESGTVNVSELSFVDKANEYLQRRIVDGMTGGVGIFEGEPFKIVVSEQGSPNYEFNGYLDFTTDLTVIGGEEIKCQVKKEHGEDWLNDVADGFSFAYLYDLGTITNGDFKKIPYVINYIPDGMQLIVLSMSIYMMTKEIIENIQEIAEAIGAIVDASTPVIGVSVGFGAGVVTAWDLGNFIWASIKVVARIAYTIAMLIAIKNLIEALFEQLLPKKRNHLAMSFQQLTEKACQHLGLQLQSQLLQGKRNWYHIPRKDKKGGESGERGFPSLSEPIYTFGDLIRVMKRMWNADFRIHDGVFYFERRDQFRVVGGYVLPSYYNNQERLLQQAKFNTNEIVANYNIFWNFDIQDQNTLDDQNGRVFQAITTPITKINENFVTIKNLAQIDLPFSQGKEKTELTQVEKILKSLGKIADDLTGIFGGGTNFASRIENRIGSLLLSSHFLTIGKVVVMNGDKLANDQRGLLRAKKLWDEYHFINSFAEINGEHNQYLLYADQRIPMTYAEFNECLRNNLFNDDQGNEIEIEFVEYLPYDGSAVVNYRLKRKYTNNLKIEYVE